MGNVNRLLSSQSSYLCHVHYQLKGASFSWTVNKVHLGYDVSVIKKLYDLAHSLVRLLSFQWYVFFIHVHLHFALISAISGFTALPPVTHAVTTCMMYLNHSCNFLLYCLSGMYCQVRCLALQTIYTKMATFSSSHFKPFERKSCFGMSKSGCINWTWLLKLRYIVTDYYQQLSKNDSWRLSNGLCCPSHCCFFFVNRF